MIDVIGVASFAAPVAGEVADIGWAPITGLALEEDLLPGYDVIPTATIAWFLEQKGAERTK